MLDSAYVFSRTIPLNDLPNPLQEPRSLLNPAADVEDRKGGFPHSEMSGSKGARASPDLIAACHVLLRLSMPRHPSGALIRLIDTQRTSCRPPLLRAAHIRSDTSCQTMFLHQSRPCKRWRRRANPSFTMSFADPLRPEGAQTLSQCDRLRGSRAAQEE